jgi:hypothetical protein
MKIFFIAHAIKVSGLKAVTSKYCPSIDTWKCENKIAKYKTI